MNTLEDIFLNIVWVTVLIILASLSILFIVVTSIGIYRELSNGKGWVYQDRNGTAYKQLIKEENGCVYAIGVWDEEIKICGSYQIKKY